MISPTLKRTVMPYIIAENINKASKKDALTARLFLMRWALPNLATQGELK